MASHTVRAERAPVGLGTWFPPLPEKGGLPFPVVRGGEGAASPLSPPAGDSGRPAKSLRFCNNAETSKMAFHNYAISLTG